MSQVTFATLIKLPSPSRMLRLLALTVSAWETRTKSRRSLELLDAHTLRDIGLNPEQAAFESQKPFWRA